MILNERPSPGRPNGSQNAGSPYVRPDEKTLKSETIQIERKTFILMLRENPRGRFLRISEEVQGRRNTIIIPSTGLEEFRRLVGDMMKTAVKLPPAKENSGLP